MLQFRPRIVKILFQLSPHLRLCLLTIGTVTHAGGCREPWARHLQTKVFLFLSSTIYRSRSQAPTLLPPSTATLSCLSLAYNCADKASNGDNVTPKRVASLDGLRGEEHTVAREVECGSGAVPLHITAPCLGLTWVAEFSISYSCRRRSAFENMFKA